MSGNGNPSWRILLFANDRVIIANNIDDATYMFRKLIDEYWKWGLNINLAKTEYISVGKKSEDVHMGKGTITCCTDSNNSEATLLKMEKLDRDRTAQGKQQQKISVTCCGNLKLI